MPAQEPSRQEQGPVDPRQIEALLERLSGGDTEAFAELFDLYRSMLKDRLAARIGPDLARKVDASDIVQETFLSAARHVAEFRGATLESFLQWLSVIASRRITDAYRHYLAYEKRNVRREVALPLGDSADGRAGYALLPDGTLGPAHHAVTSELRQRVRQAIEQLPENYREVIRLRFFEGLKLEEIARRLGKSKGAVAMLLSRAGEKLRTLLPEVSGL